MEYTIWFLVFFFGASLGSFIAVIADRYNTGRSFLNEHSFCFSCNFKLDRKDLLPIISFAFLKGRCRHCGSKIPITTILVEIIVGYLALLAASKSGFLNDPIYSYAMINFIFLTLVFSSIILISIYDLRHFIIPDSFLIAFFIFSFLGILISIFPLVSNFSDWILVFLLRLVSSFVLAAPFFLIFLFSKGKWLGFGDIKYILVIGFFLGLAQGLSAVILAFWIGAVLAIIIMFINKFFPHLPIAQAGLTMKSEIPFGPFLSLGTIISFYFNADIFQIQTIQSFF